MNNDVKRSGHNDLEDVDGAEESKTEPSQDDEDAKSDGLDSIESIEKSCRMYEQKYSQPGDIVMAHIDECEEIGARVSLPEYNNMAAMILWSDATRASRVRSLHKLLRQGRVEVVTVVRTDESRGFIDLTRRDLLPDEQEAAKLRFKQSKIVHGLLAQVAHHCHIPLLRVYSELGWPLYRQFGHAHQAFVLIGEDESGAEADRILFHNESLSHSLPASVLAQLVKHIRQRLKPLPVKVRAELVVTCGAKGGIEAIKTALLSVNTFSNSDCTLDVRVISAPVYVITGHCKSSMYKDKALQLLKDAMDGVAAKVATQGGEATVQSAPKMVGRQDEEDLRAMLAKAEKEMEDATSEEADGGVVPPP